MLILIFLIHIKPHLTFNKLVNDEKKSKLVKHKNNKK